MSGEKPREIAVEVLGHRNEGTFTEELMERALVSAELPAADRRLCQELVYGIVRWQRTLDWLIARKTSNRLQKPALQNLLRLGLYQIFWLDRIPNHAAVHVTVELAKHRGFGPQAGFVNALLRGYLRECEPTRRLLEDLKLNQPAVGYSHPDWLVDRWQSRWGTAQTAALLAWNNTPPKTFARVNELKIDAEKLLPLWRDEGVEYDFVRHSWLPESLIFELKVHPPLEKLPSFQNGFFYIQDPSTLLAVRELDPKPGETVLDLCAAPGGKLTYMAQLMNNQGKLIGHDISEERLRLITSNCARLGVACVTAASARPIERGPGLSQLVGPVVAQMQFDRILVDAPCSNTGVARRRVDLRWRIQPQEVERLKRVQIDLLNQVAPLLKTSGTLVYSTCSLEPEENRQVIDLFLKTNPRFTVGSEAELLPFSAQTDGAYVASLKRAP